MLGVASTAAAVDGRRVLPRLTSIKLQLRAKQADPAIVALNFMTRLTSISLQLSLMHALEGYAEHTPNAAFWLGLERLGPRLRHLDLSLGVNGLDDLMFDEQPLLYSEL
jgi:hypothetical protein